jgi:hypothetical protein
MSRDSLIMRSLTAAAAGQAITGAPEPAALGQTIERRRREAAAI